MEICLETLQKSLSDTLRSLAEHLKKTKQTISVAESVTAGFIQLLLSTAKDAQEIFQGGVTVYNCAQKAIHLNVDPLYAEKCNGVDQNVTTQLAQNVCHLFRSQIGIAITGYATKVPEDNINDLYAYVSIALGPNTLGSKRITTTAEGITAQWEYAKASLEFLVETIVDRHET
ncbi:MAG TPA: CinA family protein [Flavipsychrobacter sp.]|nr:CinA family protein [Flavipsychrobacter sp.]